MERIRYMRTVYPNVLKSVKTFQHPTNGARYVVELNVETKNFKIVDEVVDVQVAEGTGSSMHKVKIKVKKALEELGVAFGKEERKKRLQQQAVIL